MNNKVMETMKEVVITCELLNKEGCILQLK